MVCHSCAVRKDERGAIYVVTYNKGTGSNLISECEEIIMTTIVTDNCKDCRYTDCVAVCPVECFHYDDQMLYIDPEVCIDCSACLPECPVEAIFEENDLPEDKPEWIEINAERSKVLPVITDTMDPLPGADERKAALGF